MLLRQKVQIEVCLGQALAALNCSSFAPYKKVQTPHKRILDFWSEWRDSNSRHPAPKAGALPTALHPDTMVLYTKRMENATEIYHFREIRRLPQNCGSPGLWINSRNLPALRRKARRNRRCKFRRLRRSRPTRHCRALRAHPGSGWCPHFR